MTPTVTVGWRSVATPIARSGRLLTSLVSGRAGAVRDWQGEAVGS